ncbi:hypothetical protein [Nitrosomonas sp. Is79A3]|uniref:hypothetical protein n=1 Tax=Nitrosomonas sp. (strain Is79A3) TaxID=261292 RepID=UPI000A03B76B
MMKIPKQEYRTDLKEQAIKQVKMGKAIILVSMELAGAGRTNAEQLGIKQHGKMIREKETSVENCPPRYVS